MFQSINKGANTNNFLTVSLKIKSVIKLIIKSFNNSFTFLFIIFEQKKM